MRTTTWTGLTLGLLIALPAGATPECERLEQIYRNYEAEIDKPDSNPATLRSIVDSLDDAIADCAESEPTPSADIKTALRALEFPIFYVDESNIKSREITRRDMGELRWEIYATNVVGVSGEIDLGHISIPCQRSDGQCFPESDLPRGSIDNRFDFDGRKAKLRVRGSGDPVSLSWKTLEIMHQRFLEKHNATLVRKQALLDKENLENFVAEFRELACAEEGKSPAHDEDRALLLAVDRMSIGRSHRSHPFCYTQFKVIPTWTKDRTSKLRNGKWATCREPRSVTVIASGRRPPCK